MGGAFLIALVSRVFVFLVAEIGVFVVPENVGEHWVVDVPCLYVFARWDSAWYMNIARWGYVNIQHYAFFPLYPLLVRMFSRSFNTVLPGDPSLVLSGFLVSNLLFLASSIIIYELTKMITGREDYAFYASLSFSFYPSSVFLSAVYSESTFLFFTFLALFCWEKEKLAYTTLCSFLASLTRPVGVLLAIPMLYDVLRKNRLKIKEAAADSLSTVKLRISVKEVMPRIRDLAVGLSPVLGYSVFLTYTFLQTGDFFTHYKVQASVWGTGLHNPIVALSQLKAENPMVQTLLQTVVTIFIIISVIPILSKLLNIKSSIIPMSYVLHSLGLLCIYLSVGEIRSFPRFTLTLTPNILWMAQTLQKGPVQRILLLALSLTLLVVGTLLFTNWYEFI